MKDLYNKFLVLDSNKFGRRSTVGSDITSEYETQDVVRTMLEKINHKETGWEIEKIINIETVITQPISRMSSSAEGFIRVHLLMKRVEERE